MKNKTLLDKYNLRKWFDSTFDKNEKSILISSCPLFETSNMPYNSDSAAYFLSNTLQWYNKKENAVICLKVVSKVCELVNSQGSFAVLDLHFIYHNLIQTLYRHRDVGGAFDLCVNICERQIEIAPQAAAAFKSDTSFTGLPTHAGFEQLAIIEKKNKNFARVLELCENAKAQGWGGDWDKRIVEAKKHL